MNISFLSLTRLLQSTKVPSVPTNVDRLRALQAAWTPVVGNSYPWPYLGKGGAK